MPSAMDRSAKAPTSRAWIWVGLAACLADLGCARDGSFRMPNNPLPMLGLREKILGHSPPIAGPDLYAEELQRRQGSAGAALAANGSESDGPYSRRLRRGGAPNLGDAPASPGSLALDPLPSDVALLPPITSPGQSDASSAWSPPATTSSLAAPVDRKPDAPKDDQASSGSSAAAIRTLVEAGRGRLANVGNYQVHLNRQEQVGGALQAAEDVVLSIRSDPRAVRLEWREGPHKGREVLYSAAEPTFMHIKMADLAVPLPPMRMALDSPKVRDSSRHPITEAGLDAILQRIEESLAVAEKGSPDADRLTCTGPETPDGVDRPCHKITRVTPNGETWVVDLDAQTALPVVVQANAANGDLLERYVFRDLKTDLPDLASASAFDPAARWGHGGGGLLSRLARSGGGSPATKPTAGTTTR
jgi:hypothetical protein